MIQNTDVQQTDLTPAPPRAKARGLRSRRVRAILAGGLALGIGAAMTLAAWNDSEFAQGTFTAGAFNIQGSLDGTTYTEHATSGGAAALAFTVPAAKLSPTDSVYAPFAVELDSTSTNNAVVTVSSPSTTGSVANLTYTLIQPTTFGCTSSTTGTTLVASSALGAATGAVTFNLTKGAGVAGAPAFLCFKVTAGAGLVQSQTGSSTWQFTAASQ
jgi:predicted ribosomally synthesized peptide with SipW-like signal peptide